MCLNIYCILETLEKMYDGFLYFIIIVNFTIALTKVSYNFLEFLVFLFIPCIASVGFLKFILPLPTIFHLVMVMNITGNCLNS